METTATTRPHDYGEDFAERTLKLLPALVEDAEALVNMIGQADGG